ncbi:ssk1 response regulator receiver [Actinomortierella wolfii]|nr:ssk1 response regulator receiver [Actinomortierella wolfii]
MDPTGPQATAMVAVAPANSGNNTNHALSSTNTTSLVVDKATSSPTQSVDTSSQSTATGAKADVPTATVPTSASHASEQQQQQQQQQQELDNNVPLSSSSPSPSPSLPLPDHALVPESAPAAAPAQPSVAIAPTPAVEPTASEGNAKDGSTSGPVSEPQSVSATPGLLYPTPTTASPPVIERAHSPRLPSRPVRLIRNLHANYFSASKRYNAHSTSDSLEDTPQNSPVRIAPPRPTSAIGQAIASLQRTVYAFGASSSIVGCCALFLQSCEGQVAGPRLWIQLAYYGLFAAACSWQCIAPVFRPSDEPPSPLPRAGTARWTIGYGALSLLSSPFLISSSSNLLSFVAGPLVSLSHWAPAIVAPILYGLGTVSEAAEKDQHQHQEEVCMLKERHEQAMENCRNDHLLRKNMLLETVGKEVQDAAALAIESLRHMTPTSLFQPSVPREQLTPCTIPIPITSILGLFTTLRHLQYIARNMQRLSRVLFTEYVQGIVEKTSPHYHRGDTGFDVGEFLQSIGDLISADASLKGIELVIYHTEYELNHVQIKGSEDSWRHALINLIKSIVDWGKPGSTVELCLNLSVLPQPGQSRTKVLVSFEITYVPNPNMQGDVDDLSQLNALLASKLVKAMGGSLVIEETENRGRRFIVAVEVEVNTPASHANRAGTSTPTLAENQGRSNENTSTAGLSSSHLLVQDHSPAPSQPSSPKPGHISLGDLTLPPPRDHHRASPSLDQRLEQLQTAHQDHPSRQYYEQRLAQHSKLRTPMASPSANPASPSPRKSASPIRISQEPTVQDLLRFSRKLSGLRIVLWAKESSAFAMRLSGYLRAWGIKLTQMEIPEAYNANGKPGGRSTDQDDHSSTMVFSPVPKRSASNTSLSNYSTGSTGSKTGKNGIESGDSGSTTSTTDSNPAFVLIDDDVNVLSQQIMRLQAVPASPSHGSTKRPSHRRNKSISSIQQTHIIYFTSLPTFKQARETIMTVLNAQNPGFHYNIMSTPPTPGSNVPYILVLPKPAGPRRILTAIHTAINSPVLDQNFSPIATAPTPPAPLMRRFSEEANPMETANVWIDPDTKQAFAARPASAAPGGSPGQSPNQSMHGVRQENIQRLIDAGAMQAGVPKPPENRPASSPLLPGSTPPAVGSPKGMPALPTPAATVASSSGSSVYVQPVRAVAPSTPQMQSYKRRSGSIARVSGHIIPNSGEGIVVVPNSTTVPFAVVGAQAMNQRNPIVLEGSPTPTESGRRTPSFPLATPVSSSSNSSYPTSTTPLGYMQNSSGEYVISPPMARHSSISSTVSSSSNPARTSVSSEASNNPSSPFVSPGLERALSTTPIMESPTTAAHLESVIGLRSPGSPAPRINPASPISISKPRVVGGSSAVDASKSRSQQQPSSSLSATKKSGVVERVSPLINVLIVEDNFINQRVLVKFMQQKHIKYDVASNGKEAVDKWKVGGFHLILMDIQMPVMDGIEATRQIREMERLQRIGVTGSTYSSSPDPEKMANGGSALVPASTTPDAQSTDNSGSNGQMSSSSPSSSPQPVTGSAATATSPFKSPVIIVALTAAAKNDDTRDLALAAGCNDFITKPVTSNWLERKIVDWGCMQALIDVEGWKKWKQELEAANATGNRKATEGGRGGSSVSTAMSSGAGASGRGGGGAAGGFASGSSGALDDGKKSIASSMSRLTAKRPSITMRSIKGLKPPLKKDKEKEKEKEKEREKKMKDSEGEAKGTGAGSSLATTPAAAHTNDSAPSANETKTAEMSAAALSVPAPTSTPAASDAAVTLAERQTDNSAASASVDQ